MPSILVPGSYKILERNHGGWIEVSSCVDKNVECWMGETFCQVTCKKVLQEGSMLLLLDAVTLLGAGQGTETIDVCYKWKSPPDTKQVSQTLAAPTCFIRDHEILALKDFAREKRDPTSCRDYFILPQNRSQHFKFIHQIPYKLHGKSLWIYKDDLPYVDNICEKGMTRDGKLHLHHYMDMALALKGNIRQRTQHKTDHIEMVSSHLPLYSWRRLRRAVSLSGLTNLYSFKVMEISPSGEKKKRRARLRFLETSSCDGVKEKLPHTDTIQAVKYNGKEPMSWIEIVWNEEESKTIIVEGIQIWPAKSTHIYPTSNKIDVGVWSRR